MPRLRPPRPTFPDQGGSPAGTPRAPARGVSFGARTLIAQGRAAEARDLLEPGVQLALRQFGEQHVRTADARLALARVLLATREYAQAEPFLKAAAATYEKQRKSQPYFAAEAAAVLAELRNHRTD
jgi:hypothetical protein